jgi:hypothetical protein
VPDRLTDADHWHPHIPLAFFLAELLAPHRIVELGTWKGDSYCAFCEAVDTLGLDTSTIAVDTWRGDPQTGTYGPEVLEELRAYHDRRYGRFSNLLQATFDEGLGSVEDASVDLLHIDGYHEYEIVRHDFESWLPKVSEQGVALFHDTHVRRSGYGVWKLWDEVARKYPSVAFSNGFGVGLLVVGRRADDRVVEFVERASADGGVTERLFAVLGERVAAIGRERRATFALEDAQAELARLRHDAALWSESQRQVEALERHAAQMAAQAEQLRLASDDERAARLRVEGMLAELRATRTGRSTARLRAAYARLRRVRPSHR